MKYLKMMMIMVFTILATSAFAQDSTNQKTKVAEQQPAINYTCSMHPGIIRPSAGKCPKCGMSLIILATDKTKIYTCPIHPDITSNKPGKCPKCRMALKEKKEADNL